MMPIIIVEGKYDKIKLESITDATVVTTEGFGIFKDKAARNTLCTLAKPHGAIILTDSDRAGFKIRKYLHDILASCTLYDLYIPDIYGKERRKISPSAEGKLGVEGIPAEVLRGLLAEFKTSAVRVDPIREIDLFDCGLFGGADSSDKRRAFQTFLGLPGRLNKNMLLKVLNDWFTKQQFYEQFLIFEQTNKNVR